MAYFITYNPAFNNALLGVSEDAPLSVPEGAVVKARGGVLPDLSKMTYNPAVLDFFQRNDIRVVTKLAYLRRFTSEERVGIRAAAKANAILEDYLALLELSDEINLDDQDTLSAVQMLEGAGLIGAGRAAEILA